MNTPGTTLSLAALIASLALGATPESHGATDDCLHRKTRAAARHAVCVEKAIFKPKQQYASCMSTFRSRWDAAGRKLGAACRALGDFEAVRTQVEGDLDGLIAKIGGNDGSQNDLTIEPIPATDPLAPYLAKRVRVFGATVAASSSVPEAKLLHAATVLAEYLDNDENGTADDPAVIAALEQRNATLLMFANEREGERSGIFESDALDGIGGQDLYAEETLPAGRFDATLEEVLHLIQRHGYEVVYPDQVGVQAGSALTRAMDIARGGHFQQIPNPYPTAAWYHYDDQTCDYGCMAGEYFYWGLTTHLGAQSSPDRCDEIRVEWEVCTPEAFRSRDPALHALVTSPELKLPTVLPDGRYRP